ncbi:transporter substrate-binding domain-containing protein [Nocardiopsis sp. CT-R113]|uniref:Transporter substrate-binding domain-containing protein n=1 Tax=Nocardiopsis codii TaxID=3065942 RepID=A0ABU7KD44_9ACTN|nr:transporter substrate-binding domain-containing protein [Nocardiopsis sp. CT-R113]MEE2039522.1 transporter substrate-binding domain-containing protein [Nocardiopsis sp. CT-R113]
MKTRATALIALSALALATGCTDADSGDGADAASPDGNPLAGSRLGAILDSGTLRVCTTGDYRPFTYLDPGTDEFTGIDVDMARDLADDMGVEIEWVQTSWDDLMEDFLAGCDIAAGGISISTARSEQVYFSAALMEDGKTPITLCENVDDYRTIEQINQPGVRSIMPSGGTNEIFAEEHYPEGELIRHDNNTIFDEIIAGNADVMTTDASETLWVANEHEELCAVHPDEPFDYFEKAFMLPLGDEVLKHYVDQWLNIALNDGTWDGIVEPWFGEDVEL